MSGQINRKEVPFSQISNGALRDEKLSLKAKGLYSLIQSYITIPNFVLYKTTLLNKCLEKEKSFESAWKELKDKGYLIQHKTQNDKGFFEYNYELIDFVESIHTPKIHPVDNPHLESPPSGEGGVYNKTDLNNTDLNNTYKEIIDFLNLKTESNYRYTSKETIKNIKARLNEGYTVEDFKTVIERKSKQWLNDEKMNSYLRPITLFSPKFEGYLNEKDKKTEVKEKKQFTKNIQGYQIHSL